MSTKRQISAEEGKARQSVFARLGPGAPNRVKEVEV